MSHFSVAVFSHTKDEVDSLMAPFSEDVVAGSPYAVFTESNHSDIDETTGKKGYWSNPNGTWDWYVVGGRWSGLLKLLPGKTGISGYRNSQEDDRPEDPDRCDIAYVRDCDYSPNQKAYDEALRVWDVAVNGVPLTTEEKERIPLLLFKREYYIQQYGTRENYAKSQSDFMTYAFVTAEGEWHETGRMGWWGFDDATMESRETYRKEFEEYLRKAVDQNLIITIVDCHI